MLRFGWFCVILVALLSVTAHAADPAQLKRFLESKRCSGCDLSKANFAEKNLAGADLSNAKLNGANLSGANLVGANLRFADLTGTDLRYADLRQANLDGANWRKAILCSTTLPGGQISNLTC